MIACAKMKISHCSKLSLCGAARLEMEVFGLIKLKCLFFVDLSLCSRGGLRVGICRNFTLRSYDKELDRIFGGR